MQRLNIFVFFTTTFSIGVLGKSFMIVLLSCLVFFVRDSADVQDEIIKMFHWMHLKMVR